MQINSLTCEYLNNPLGIDILEPRLSWKLISSQRGAKQTAYQILAASSEEKIAINDGDLWDTGRVDSDQSVHVVYEGLPLHAGQRAWWKVRAWDEAGQHTEYSAPAWWEMGLLEKSGWQAQWIGSPLVGGQFASTPAPYVRQTFTLTKNVSQARLYISALGVYEPYLNGQRVGDDVFTPGWTDYSKRVQYQTYDVTAQLKSGENVIGAILGDGWYCGYVGWLSRQYYGDRPKLLAQMVIMFEDGTAHMIVTDGTWETATGAILASDMIMGESYDARHDLGAWSEPGYDASAWQQVQILPDTGIEIVAPVAPPVRRIEEIQPVADPVEFPGRPVSRWVFDFGQNLVGRVRLKISGDAGRTVSLCHSEMLKPDGTVYTENLRTTKQTDHYTLRGDGEETYEPVFTFHGFRYVELSNFPGRATRDMLTAVVLHSDLPMTGAFECSDPLINQLQHNIQWGQKGNFLDVPTDCPQRNERLGWTGDAQVFVRTAAFNMDVAGFFAKWQRSLADGQQPNGTFPLVAPDVVPDRKNGGPAWSDAGVICPWTIHTYYGDTRLLEQHYESMRRFIEFMLDTSPAYIRSDPAANPWQGYGDWLSTNADTPKDLIGTAFFSYSTKLLSRIARILGENADAERYERLADDVRKAFLNRFVTPHGFVVGNTQTAYVLALHFDLLPEELRPVAVDELVRDIEKRGMHLSTGFVGTPYLLHVLSRFGRLHVAYALLNQKSFPSWLYSVTQGATTIWERWDGWTHDRGFQDPSMNSFNHYAYGAVGDWLYSTAAGLDADPEHPGYKRVVLRPSPGGNLRYAKAAHESLYGRIESGWSVEQGTLHYRVIVPPNTTATVYMPAFDPDTVNEGGEPAAQAEGVKFLRYDSGAAVFEVGSGEYQFSAPARYIPLKF